MDPNTPNAPPGPVAPAPPPMPSEPAAPAPMPVPVPPTVPEPVPEPAPPPAPKPLVEVVPPVNPKPKYNWALLIGILLFLASALALTGYFAYQYYQLKNQVSQVQPTVPPSEAPAGLGDWKTYTNTAIGFTINYPESWRLVGTETSTNMIGFGPASIGEDVQWAINIYTNKTNDQIIAEMGKQFTDRKVQRDQITVDGLAATMVTVTTASTPTWIFQQVLISSGGKIIAISNGAITDPKFTDFYKSFKLTI